MKLDNQRLFDIVRCCRFQLHQENLITDEEYLELAQDHAAVARLESYDLIRHKAKHLYLAANAVHSTITILNCPPHPDEVRRLGEALQAWQKDTI